MPDESALVVTQPGETVVVEVEKPSRVVTGTTEKVTVVATSPPAVVEVIVEKGTGGTGGGTGTPGEPGKDGDSAYEVAVNEGGFTGTVAQWLTSLKGTNGATPTVGVGSVTTLESTEPVSVTEGGTATARTFNFAIPKGAPGAKGDKGDAATNIIKSVNAKTGDVVLSAADVGAVKKATTDPTAPLATVDITNPEFSNTFSEMLTCNILGKKTTWFNEQWRLRGIPWAYPDPLVRGIRENNDGGGGGTGPFIHLNDRRTGASSVNLYARDWEGRLTRTGNLMSDSFWKKPGTALPTNLPVGTFVAETE